METIVKIWSCASGKAPGCWSTSSRARFHAASQSSLDQVRSDRSGRSVEVDGFVEFPSAASRSTIPIDRASKKPIERPVIKRSRPSSGPINRGSWVIAPQAGIKPSWTSGTPIWIGTFDARATRRRQASASSRPPPRHTPWITATVGFVRAR